MSAKVESGLQGGEVDNAVFCKDPNLENGFSLSLWSLGP